MSNDEPIREIESPFVVYSSQFIVQGSMFIVYFSSIFQEHNLVADSLFPLHQIKQERS